MVSEFLMMDQNQDGYSRKTERTICWQMDVYFFIFFYFPLLNGKAHTSQMFFDDILGFKRFSMSKVTVLFTFYIWVRQNRWLTSCEQNSCAGRDSNPHLYFPASGATPYAIGAVWLYATSAISSRPNCSHQTYRGDQRNSSGGVTGCILPGKWRVRVQIPHGARVLFGTRYQSRSLCSLEKPP